MYKYEMVYTIKVERRYQWTNAFIKLNDAISELMHL